MGIRIPVAKERGNYRFRKWTESFFYITVFIFVLVYIISLILNYDVTWVHPEYVAFYNANMLKNGVALAFEDFLRCFDTNVCDRIQRARFIAYTFQIVDIKFLIWLLNYIPPHPSLSLTWIFSLILCPVLLFKLIRDMTRSRTAAWIGISLYCVSSGFLYDITMYHCAAKPLASFFTLLCLYCSLKVSRYIREQGYFSNKTVVLYIFLLCLLFLAFCTDETTWFLLVCIPVLFPSIFTITRKRALIILSFFSTYIFFLLFVTFIVPQITRLLGFETFNFWRFAGGGKFFWQGFQFKNLIYNGSKLLFCHVIPAREGYTAFNEHKHFSIISINYGIVFFLCFIYLVVKMPPERKRLFLHWFIVLPLFILFHSIIHLRHEPRVSSCFYYGGLFSIFFAILFSIVLSSFKKGLSNTLSKLMLTFIIGTSAFNFFFINKSWMDVHIDRKYYRDYWKAAEQMKQKDKLTYTMVLRAWRSRSNRETLFKMIPEFPLKSWWLFRELEYIGNGRENLLSLKPAVITAAPRSLPGGEVCNLLDNDATTVWQVAPDKVGSPTWVMVDFGEGRDKVVRSLEARPYRNNTGQFFSKAELQGSMNGKNWETIAPIVQKKRPHRAEPRSWTFNNAQAFRYYRLLINDGHQGISTHCLYSIAELAMFE